MGAVRTFTVGAWSATHRSRQWLGRGWGTCIVQSTAVGLLEAGVVCLGMLAILRVLFEAATSPPPVLTLRYVPTSHPGFVCCCGCVRVLCPQMPVLPRDTGSFHCSLPRLMPLSAIDPSLAIGFFCADAGGWLPSWPAFITAWVICTQDGRTLFMVRWLDRYLTPPLNLCRKNSTTAGKQVVLLPSALSYASCPALPRPVLYR